MSESVSSAAPQPQQSAATNGGVTTANNEVGENMTGSSVRAMLFQRDMARQAAPVNSAEVQATPEAENAEPATTQPAEDATQTAPETDTPEATEGETPEGDDGVPDDVLSQLSSLDPKHRLLFQRAIEESRKRDQEKIDKRIGKERAKRGAIEQQLKEAQIREQTLSAQIRQPQQQQPPQATPAFDANQPLADVQTPEALQQRAKEAKDTVRFVNDILDSDGIENGVEIHGKVWSKAELKAARRNAQITLEDHVPMRAQFFQQRQNSVTQAIEKYPFMKDEASTGYAKAQALITNPQYRWLKDVPNAAEILGNLVEGEMAVEARKKAQAAPARQAAALRPRPASDQTVSSAVGAGGDRTTGASRGLNAVAAELARLNEKGNVTGGELRDFLKRKDQFR